jgi:hypothetical protein
MKWSVLTICLAASPAMAVYQPNTNEAQLLQTNRDGLQQNMKFALPLQTKSDICFNYLKVIGQKTSEEFNSLQYWIRVKRYVDASIKLASDRFPRLYYYDKKLYEKFGQYPKGNETNLNELWNVAKESNYLNINDYLEINQKYAESLRQKNLNKVCVESVTAKMSGELNPATASMDKLFFPGTTDSSERGKYYQHLYFTQLMNKIEDSYY